MLGQDAGDGFDAKRTAPPTEAETTYKNTNVQVCKRGVHTYPSYATEAFGYENSTPNDGTQELHDNQLEVDLKLESN